MRVLFRLWVVWALLWAAVMVFGIDGPATESLYRAMALIVGGPLVVLIALKWVFKAGQS